MNPLKVRALLRDAARAGITPRVEGNRLRYKAQTGEIPAALRAELLTAKDEIMMELDQPVFRNRDHKTSQLLLPEYWIDFWRETQANLCIANQTNITFNLAGDIGLEDLHAAFDALAARYDILRARVTIIEGVPCLLYDQWQHLPVEVVDLCAADANSRSSSLEDIVNRTLWTPFGDGSLFRACVVRASANEYVVALVLHHFVGDFHSCQILATELVAMLHADRRRKLLASPRPMQYSDYHCAMNEWICGPGLTYRLAYWREQMQDAPPTRIPRDFEPGAASSPTALDSISFEVDAALRARIGSLAGSSGVTPAMVVLAASFAALSQVIQRSDVVITLIATNRDQPALVRLVGGTVNCFPVRVSVVHDMSFATLVTGVNEAYALARDYQVPWALLMRTLAAQNVSCIAPTFNFVSHRRGTDAGLDSFLQSNARSNIVIKRPPQTGTVSWKSHSMNVVDSGHMMSGIFQYAPGEYHKATVVRLEHALLQCLRRVTDNPTCSIGESLAAQVTSDGCSPRRHAAPSP